METSWAAAFTRHSGINIFYPSGQHNFPLIILADKRRGTTAGHWHSSPRDLSLSAKQARVRRVLVFCPCGTFTIGILLSLRPLPFQPLFFSSSSPARPELMYDSWLEWLYARTRAHFEAKRMLSVPGECGQCGVSWEKRCRVISTHTQARILFSLGVPIRRRCINFVDRLTEKKIKPWPHGTREWKKNSESEEEKVNMYMWAMMAHISLFDWTWWLNIMINKRDIDIYEPLTPSIDKRIK